jgi:putative superfamily III holin-X
MFQGIRKARIVIPFVSQRMADYAELAHLELITFRNEMIAAIVGAAVGVVSLLLLLCFICIALLITEWDTPYRILAAWLVAVAWGLVATGCVVLGRLLMKGHSPFKNIASEVALDLSVIKTHTDLDRE